MPAPWNVVKVQVVAPLTLWVEHRDGVCGRVRFEPSHLTGVFEILQDPDYFARVDIAHGVVSWPDEMPDLAPDAMHDALARNGEWVLN
jgi:hypothetical protein